MALLTSGINSGQLSEVTDAYKALCTTSHQGSNVHYFDVDSAGDKGDGCFAVRQILPGTLLHQETPLFIIHEIGDGELSEPAKDAISAELARLSPADHAEYMRLVDPGQIRRTRQKNDIRIFEANSFETERHTGRRTTDQGIFLKAARFNHSCVPNAYFQWNPRIDCLTIFAISRIDRKGEILVNYKCEDIYKPRAERRQNLDQGYRFECECQACHDGPFHDESESLRASMKTIDTNIQQQIGHLNVQRHRVNTLISLLGAAGCPYPQKADLYERLAVSYLAEMDQLGAGHSGNITECRRRARDAARGKLMAEILSIGPNTEEVDRSLALIAAAGYHEGSG
ncbi:MAG: hypothetical protein L6R42_002120 [Xanthoria sp. 1 TBL-2021]|nr:MAG: hypothetical protein L6R42_002120 [Xanthoria sp. 1 TBL-2021]